MASRDDHLEAGRLAREAVDLTSVETPNLRADLLVDLAKVLLSAQQSATAEPVIAEAIQLYERKGNLVSALEPVHSAGGCAGAADYRELAHEFMKGVVSVLGACYESRCGD